LFNACSFAAAISMLPVSPTTALNFLLTSKSALSSLIVVGQLQNNFFPSNCA